MSADSESVAASGPQPGSLGRGTNQSSVRLYNERLVLSLIRRHGSVPKAEIARRSGLSAQTASVIVNSLEAEGLLVKQDRQRGRVGQPSVPFALNPDGAFSIGLKIGRRSTDLVLVDFLGTTRKRIRTTHRYPEPVKLLAFLRKGLATLRKEIAGVPLRRIAGLGIATPFELWNWQREAGAPVSAMKAWRGFDTQAEVAALCDFPVHLCNDGTAACAAECFFGGNERFRDFLYVFIGSFVGGGIVLNGNVVLGRTGNAGAIGSMPIAEIGKDGVVTTRQLIRCASLYTLEQRLEDAGVDSSRLWTSSEIWPDFGEALDDWAHEAAASLAVLAASAASIIDFEAVVIDGAFPAAVRSLLVAATRKAYAGLDLQGLSPLDIVEGTIGPDARAIGGAALPLIADFARDREVLFRESAVA